MGIGIQICGKSTLGKVLAEKIGFHFIDSENLYFSRTNINEPYKNPKLRADVETWLQMVNCLIIRVDGSKPIEDNVEYIIKEIGI